jgi:hypothetical protein
MKLQMKAIVALLLVSSLLPAYAATVSDDAKTVKT